MVSKLCKDCGIEKPLEDFYDAPRKASVKSAYCRDCTKRRVRDYASQPHAKVTASVNKKSTRTLRKQKAVELLGGRCIVCGYDKCIAALDFHHLDPHTKEKAVSAILASRAEVDSVELRKCVLLCANCHREFHYGIISIPTEWVS